MKEIKTKQMGEVWIASDGEVSSIGSSEHQARLAIEDSRRASQNHCCHDVTGLFRLAIGNAFPAPKPNPLHPECPNCGGCSTFEVFSNDYHCTDCNTTFQRA